MDSNINLKKDWSEAILGSIGDGVIALDIHDKIIYINNVACEIFDMSKDDLSNMAIDEVMSIRNDSFKNISTLAGFVDVETNKQGGVPKNTYIITNKGIRKYISVHMTVMDSLDQDKIGKVFIVRDITRIVSAEHALIREKENMVTMFHELPIGMIIIDKNIKILNANIAFKKMMGLLEKDISGMVLGDAIECIWSFKGGCGHSGNCIYCKLRAKLRTYIRENKQFKNFLTEIKYIYQGKEKSSWLNLCFLPNNQDAEIKYLLTVEDHTERIEYEQNLTRAKNSSIGMLDTLPFMIFKLDERLKCNFLNESLKKYLDIDDISEFEIIKERISEIELNDFSSRIRGVLDKKESFNLEIDISDKYGEKRRMIVFGRPVVENSINEKEALFVIMDVQERKMSELLYLKSERKYYSLFQNLESSISYYNMIYDEFGNPVDAEIIEYNDATYNILNFLNEDLNGKRLSDMTFLSELERERLIYRFNKASISGVSDHIEEFHMSLIDRWIQLSIYSPERDFVVMLITDIDEKKRTELALVDEKERSEEANRVKSEFLANMSHEIRTPLNGIVGMIDITLMEHIGEEQRENLLTAKECVTSLIDIINDILDFSKIEAGKLKIEEDSFDLRELVENTVKIHLKHLNDKRLGLSVDFSRISHSKLVGDAKRIKQVLNNLLSNAIKFTDEGEISLKVEQFVTADKEKPMTRFVVSDTGVGIREDKQNLLFNSFTQLDGTYTRTYGGTGLGLVISKQLVEMMKGTIGFKSKYGVGSTFEFILPLREAYLENHIENKEEILSENCKGKMILLVEDDKVNQIVMQKMIERYGVEVKIANNGYEALQQCNVDEFDLILMDIQMPVMDGIEGTRQIRMNSVKNRFTPVIALTAFALKGDEEIFTASGMDGYVSKPVNANTLIKLMNETLGREKMDGLQFGAEIEEKIRTRIFDKEKESRVLNSETIYELKHRIRQLEQAYRNENYMVLEVVSHQLKVRFEALKIEELKNIAFKIELELRKERYDRVSGLIDQLTSIIEGFDKN